jgi:hypothetical protein
MIEKTDVVESTKILSQADTVLASVDDAFIQRYHQSRPLPTFRSEELSLGKVLGTGGFGIVYEITKFSIDQHGDGNLYNTVTTEGNNQNSMNVTTLTPFHLHGNNERGETNDRKNNATCQRPRQERVRIKAASSHASIKTSDLSQKERIRVKAYSSYESMNTHIHFDVNIAKEWMEKSCSCTSFKDVSSRYALKRLQKGLTTVERARGMIDLAIEAKYLSIIWHPNIST